LVFPAYSTPFCLRFRSARLNFASHLYSGVKNGKSAKAKKKFLKNIFFENLPIELKFAHYISEISFFLSSFIYFLLSFISLPESSNA
jgi:hypothetical protein